MKVQASVKKVCRNCKIVRRKGSELDEKTIRHELEGNICRCTGYHNIVKAIAAGAAAMAPAAE